jgi:alkaline phosphatase
LSCFPQLAFDQAAWKALEFAKADGNTLVVAVADHGTGGISMGIKEDKNYSQTDDDDLQVPMRGANLLTLNGRTVELEGVISYAEKLDKVHVPRQAIELVSAGL